MYLIDTNVISEARKGARANPGVRAFFDRAASADEPLFLSVITVGELRRGALAIRHRGELPQAQLLERWLKRIVSDYADRILDLDTEAAQVWGRLRVPHAEHAIDKQIAAIALVNGLAVVTRNVEDFAGTGVELMNPFTTA